MVDAIFDQNVQSDSPDRLGPTDEGETVRAMTRKSTAGPRVSRAALAAVTAVLVFATGACTTTLTDADGAPDASAKLLSQDVLDARMPKTDFYGSDMKDTDGLKNGWFANCSTSDYPDPADEDGATPDVFTITGKGNNVDAKQLDVAIKVTAFDKRSTAKTFNTQALDALAKCPASEEIGAGTSSASNLTYVPTDYSHGAWKGKLLLSKVSRNNSGQTPTKDVQVTAIAATSNISVLANLYGLDASDQDASLSKIKSLVDSLLDKLDDKG